MGTSADRSNASRPGGARRVVAVTLALTLMPIAAIAVYLSFFTAPAPPQRALAEEHDDTQRAEHEHTNQLINENSPYLQMHAHNPIDWYPWGEAAFEKAKR